MKNYLIQIFVAVFFVALSVAYYSLTADIFSNVDKIFLTLATFLFSVFTGFFISRQGTRYSEIRKLMADLDGMMSSIYRVSGHMGEEFQKAVGEVIVAHYKPMIATGEWDYSFTHKTSTLTDLHRLLKKNADEKGLDGIKSAATGNILGSLHTAQLTRKNMVALREERVPAFQWILIWIIAIIVFFAVSAIPSVGFAIGSMIKAAFISSVLVVIIMLEKLDKLRLFEGRIGAHLAQDVVDIIEGKK